MNNSITSSENPWVPSTPSTGIDTVPSYDSDCESPYLSEKDILECISYKMHSDNDSDDANSTFSAQTAFDHDHDDHDFGSHSDPQAVNSDPPDFEAEAAAAYNEYNNNHRQVRTSPSSVEAYLIDDVPIYRYEKEPRSYSKLGKFILSLLATGLALVISTMLSPLSSPFDQAAPWIIFAVHLLYFVFAGSLTLFKPCNPIPRSFWNLLTTGMILHGFMWYLVAITPICASELAFRIISILNIASFIYFYSQFIFMKPRGSRILSKYTYGCLAKLEDSLGIRFPQEKDVSGLNREYCIWLYESYDLMKPILDNGGARAAYNIAKLRAIYRAITNVQLVKHQYESYVHFPPMTLLEVYKFVNQLELDNNYINRAEFRRREEVFTVELEARELTNQVIELK